MYVCMHACMYVQYVCTVCIMYVSTLSMYICIYVFMYADQIHIELPGPKDTEYWILDTENWILNIGYWILTRSHLGTSPILCCLCSMDRDILSCPFSMDRDRAQSCHPDPYTLPYTGTSPQWRLRRPCQHRVSACGIHR